MQRIQWKISHKGLIVVAVPLLFEIAFVAGLVGMLRTADQQALELTRSRELVSLASDLDNTLAYAGYALISWKMVPSERLVKRYEDLVAHASKVRARMKDLAQDRQSRQQLVAGVDEACSQVTFLTSNFRRPQDSSMLFLMNKGAYLGQIQRAYGVLYDKTQELIVDEGNVQSGSSNLATQSKSFIYTLIGLAVLFNVALTCALAIYFSKSITRRIGVLTDNAQRFSKGSSLNAPVTGDDEIASLDRVFHKMTTDLRETEQRKQDFVSMITHDLRSPLTSIRTISATLAEGAEARADAEDRQRIGVLERSLDRMINLVNDLLDIDKIEAGLLVLDLSPTNFQEVLESAIESVRHLAEHRDIKITSAADVAEVDIDQKRIGQVLVNLIANAIKFSPRGSTVSVIAECDDRWLTVKVIDTGKGIPEEQLNSIFDRFKQAGDGSAQGGSGLGLAISKALVELHHGTIGVESSADKGSTFWFKVPLRQQTGEN